jgi:DNA helicase II / ATP-dependent DNA helicase PcrA
MKILLAGPGTGKTTKIKSLIKEDYSDAKNILVLSFTNATVNDLTQSFEGFSTVKCYTLHSYALIINHLSDIQILDDNNETLLVSRFSEKHSFEFKDVCYFLQCITFDNMIKSCLSFLKSNPAYGKDKIGNLDLLIIDEFQDFNLTERDLIYELSKYANETLILGDDDQSIYGFKDADPLGIIELFNRQDIEKLQHENKCYRCPDAIVDSSTKLIKKNKNRIDKDWLKTGKDGEYLFTQTVSQSETSQIILNTIKGIKESNPDGSILVLSPVRYYTEELIELMKKENIDLVDFWTPKINADDIKKVWWLRALYSNKKILNLTFLANTILSKHYKDKYNTTLAKALQNNFDEDKIITQVAEMFPEPFSDYLINPPHILDFIRSHQEFSSLEGYINFEDVDGSLINISKKLSPTVEFQKKSVNIMSIHKSKGLQADYVFITGLVEGVLPNKVKGLDTIEAQRRLLFVGMTRAIKSLYMMSQVEWEGKYVHKLDKTQFKFNYRKKIYSGKTSNFISEME